MGVVYAVAMAVLIGVEDKGGDWPQFNGPNRNNLSIETGLLKQWPEQGPTLEWTAHGIGHGFSSVSIADGRIYTAGNIGERTFVTALDLAGKIVWQADVGRAWFKPVPGTRGTPTIDAERLYYETPHGRVVCLQTSDGKLLWGRNLVDAFGAQRINWAFSESLLLDSDRLIVSPGGLQTAVVALDKMTGRTVWQSPPSGDKAGYASPILAEHDGLRMILTLSAKALIGIHADTGDLLFRFEHETPFDETITMPLYHEGHIYISTRSVGSVGLAIQVDGQKASLKTLWRTPDLDNQHGGVILLGGHLYGACLMSNDGKWVCLDTTTGEKRHAERGVGKGSLTYADGMFYTLSEKGLMGLIPATPERHEVVSQFRIPPGGDKAVWAHPVVCGGRLYVRHSDFLYVYDVLGGM